MTSKPQSKRLLEFAVMFAALYLLSSLLLRTFFPQEFSGQQEVRALLLRPVDATVRLGHHPVFLLRSSLQEDLQLPDRCPAPPLDIYRVNHGGTSGEILTPLTASDPVLPCKSITRIPGGLEVTIDLGPWKYPLFASTGVFEARLPVSVSASADGEVVKARFAMHEAGIVVQLFRVFVTKPLLNTLVFLASILPGYSLGGSIILLTLLVKLLLYFPTQRSLEGQRRMQALQPKTQELRKKYGEDPKRLQEETMKLWKEHGVNPVQSCLPMLLQFPVLIGIFFVIRDGVPLELSQHLLYEVYQDLPWRFGTDFMAIDLTVPNIVIMPLSLAFLQFVQMKLSFHFAKEKMKGKEKSVGGEKILGRDPQELQQQVMLYALPLMVGFFAIQFPAAISLYWGMSTLFAIGQQIVVNRKQT